MNCHECGCYIPEDDTVCPACGVPILQGMIKDGSITGTLKIGNSEYEVYLGGIEAHEALSAESGRTMDGVFHIEVIRTIHKFTLIEV